MGHTAKRVFHWAPEISNGTEEDLIVMPNVPLLGAINKMRADGRTQFEINAFTGMLRLVVDCLRSGLRGFLIYTLLPSGPFSASPTEAPSSKSP